MPDKGQMYLAPAEVLGYYCGLDAYSTILLYKQVLLKAVETKLTPEAVQFFKWFSSEVFISNVKFLIEQQLDGIYIDREGLTAHYNNLDKLILERRNAFLNHPDILNYNQQKIKYQVNELIAAEPPKFNKQKPVPKEPARYNKKGEETERYQKWLERYAEWEAEQLNQQPAKRWLLWEEKLNELKKSTEGINLNSGPQLRELFYTYLKYPVIVTTDTNQPAVGKQALQGFGEHGRLLKSYVDTVKEKGYVERCLEKSEATGFIHPQFIAPGTLTGRLAGSGGWNAQQQPKSRDYLKNLKARPGCKWVQADISALEQVVLAELSECPTLNFLYGSGIKNDVYLFNAANIPQLNKDLLEIYNPQNPTPESIDQAKKEFKKIRNISKTLSLAASYGAGPGKIYQTLRLSGIDISEAEVRDIHAAYWNLYKRVKEYGSDLFYEWRQNRGWVYNGLGLPVVVHKDLTKDLVNRVVQGTGHQILMVAIYYMYTLREESGRTDLFYPIIIDFHDESIVECLEEDTEEVTKLINKAYLLTNELLGGSLTIEAEPDIVDNLADIKCEPIFKKEKADEYEDRRDVSELELFEDDEERTDSEDC
jgi:hypothetical protein